MKKEQKSKIVMFRLTESGYNAFKLLCKKKGIELSTALREAIKDYYIKNK